MTRRKLPIGIQTFRKIREQGYYYVDKTEQILRLLRGGGVHHFLSRPRRFGKSLLLDTIRELFEGNEPLFEGLAIHSEWDWSVRYPVLSLSFGSGHFTSAESLPTKLSDRLTRIEQNIGVSLKLTSIEERLEHIIETLRRNHGQEVVLLIDEYDKPILDALDFPQVARANRDLLRGVYAVVKERDKDIRFSLIAGVSRFSKVNLFSGLNNLIDISLDARHSDICGYTERDLDEIFAPELSGLDRNAIREWYNGYSWLGEERMYNPFDVLLLFDRRQFGAWWFETGTPRFLVETLARRAMPSPKLERLIATDALLATFDIDHMSTEALLFQTGYLTIDSQENSAGAPAWRLKYPNREVRQGLNEHLLRHLLDGAEEQPEHSLSLHRLLSAGDLDGIHSLMSAIFAGIPHDWHRKNRIAQYEGYYASVFYSYFAGAGIDVQVEDATQRGRLDMSAHAAGRVYIFEFKVIEQAGAGSAMAQLKERGYAEKYLRREQPVHLVGVEFSSESRTIERFDTRAA